MKIAILAVQGAFMEHKYILQLLGAETVELRKNEDLKQDFDGIILPGGESTVQGKLLRELYMFEDIKRRIQQGMPVLATCAGLILLAEQIANSSDRYFATLPVTVQRNAYGRQLGSFSTMAHISGISEEDKVFPLKFIRAPYIQWMNNKREVKPIVSIKKMPDGSYGENIVGVRYKNQIGLAFHPELTIDYRFHEIFLKECGHNHVRVT
ncbi:MAG: pyridoxal 5'-phosphate synthase glutaminase subunit PdxT [Lachnospiraceae bacterium]